MSSAAVHETQIPLEVIARELDSDFQFVADRLPNEVKEGFPGEAFTLAAIKDVGVLWAEYGGQRPSTTGEALCQFVVRIGMLIDSQHPRLCFTKEFELSFQTLYSEGPLTDLKPTSGEDLVHCPGSLSLLAFTVQSLRYGFIRQRGIENEHTVDVSQLDAYRVN